MTTLTLYGKPDCCLCGDAKGVIDAARAEWSFELREVDVSTDPALLREYGERIPVLAVDGEEVFELHVDPLELRDLLDRVAT